MCSREVSRVLLAFSNPIFDQQDSLERVEQKDETATPAVFGITGGSLFSSRGLVYGDVGCPLAVG